MTVVITMINGDIHRIDRNEGKDTVARQINTARASNQLIQFQNDDTPSRTFYLDPNLVMSVTDDGYAF